MADTPLTVTITMEKKWLAVIRVNGQVHAKLQHGEEYEVRVLPLEFENISRGKLIYTEG